MKTANPITAQQSRKIDKYAGEILGIPSIVLMENAALNATSIICAWLDNSGFAAPENINAAIVCGGGNNGGDGYAVARHLYNLGANVKIYAAKSLDKLKSDAKVNADICHNMGIKIIANLEKIDLISQWRDSDILIDAVLGVGFCGDLRDPVRKIIGKINLLKQIQNGPEIIALDVPSGLNCDTGKPETGKPNSIAVKADMTITFAASKVGFSKKETQKYLGALKLAPIGIAPDAIKQAIK